MKKVSDWFKSFWRRLKKAARAFIDTFKEEDNTPVIEVVHDSKWGDVFHKAGTKIKEFCMWAMDHPLEFSVKAGVLTTLLTIPGNAISKIFGGMKRSVDKVKTNRESATKFYDWDNPGVYWYTKRPMNKREANYFAAQRAADRNVGDILDEMGLVF